MGEVLGALELQPLGLSCSLRQAPWSPQPWLAPAGLAAAGAEAGFRTGPPGLAQDHWQWPSLASLLIPGLTEAFLAISPSLPFSSAMPGPLWVAMCTSSRPSQQFSLLMQLLRLVSSGCQAYGQVSTPCPVLESTARTNGTCPSRTRSRPGRKATGGAGGKTGGRCALVIGRAQGWDTGLQEHGAPGTRKAWPAGHSTPVC